MNANDYFDMKTYGPTDERVSNVFYEQAQAIAQYVPEYAKDIYSSLKEKVMYVNSEYFRDTARAMANIVDSAWKGNTIRPLLNIGELQAAPPVMRRWVMAEPTIRKIYHNQECEGYGDRYVDVEPNSVGEQHTDYQRVMNGMMQETKDGYEFATYINEDIYEDSELDIVEQVEIITTWDAIKSACNKRVYDPTSLFNGRF